MKSSIKDLYAQLYNEAYVGKTYKDGILSSFVAMRGSKYEQQPIKLMLVGRAVNGWGFLSESTTVEEYSKNALELFEQSKRFSTEWCLHDISTNPYSIYNDKSVAKKYYLSKSPFWNYTHSVWCELTGVDKSSTPNWFENIVWSNLYKLAPEKCGNPSDKLCKAQASICIDILREEIRVFQPTHVLIESDTNWFKWSEGDFNNAFDVIETSALNNKIVKMAFTTKVSKVVVTCRPEQRNLEQFTNSVIAAFNVLK